MAKNLDNLFDTIPLDALLHFENGDWKSGEPEVREAVTCPSCGGAASMWQSSPLGLIFTDGTDITAGIIPRDRVITCPACSYATINGMAANRQDGWR